MKPLHVDVPVLRKRFHHFFSSTTRNRLFSHSQPGLYPRKIDPFVLIVVLMESYLLLASGLRAIAGRAGARLRTSQISTLSYALGSPLIVRLVRAMLDKLSFEEGDLGREDVVALDSMAVSLPKTKRHNCRKMNSQTVGGGILWGLCLTVRRSLSPVRVLAVIEGAWHDSKVMDGVRLIAKGPLYLMDRGFYKIDALVRWMTEGVRFIVRVQEQELVYQEQERLGRAGRHLKAKITKRGGRRKAIVRYDGTATVGGASRRGERPTVRFLIVDIIRGRSIERLILASSELTMGAQELLDLYGRRWEIEEFHRVLKRAIGLAHLYSFRQRGLELLVLLAALLAVLLWIDEETPTTAGSKAPTVPQLIRQALFKMRQSIGMGNPWRPNTVARGKFRHRR